MTEKELSEIEARANAASHGPWLYSARRHEVDTAQPAADGEIYDYRSIGSVEPGMYAMPDADGEFIAHAREDVPKLLAEVRRLRGLIKQAENVECESGPFCPWCTEAPFPRGEHGCKNSLECLSKFHGHKQLCPAFTPEGDVK